MEQGNTGGRPAVLENATETQIMELEQQFNEQDRQAWKILTQSYGWTDEESQAVWNWFGNRPGTQPGMESQPQTGGSLF